MSDKPIVYEQDGKVVYRASALGGCLRGLVAARQGYEAAEVLEKLKEVFEAGKEAEEWYLNEMKLMGPPESIEYTQYRVEVPITSRIEVAGHWDGLRSGRVLEIKSQSPDVFKEWTPGKWETDSLWMKYAWQVSVYMLFEVDEHGGRELELVRINRENQVVDRHYYEKPFHSLSEIRARVLLIESLATEDTLPPCEHEEWGCPFRYLHEGPELVDDLKVIGLTESYLVHKRAIEGHQKEMKEAREKLEKRLGEKKKVVLPSGVLITRSDVTVEDHMVKGSSYTRLLITPPKEKK